MEKITKRALVQITKPAGGPRMALLFLDGQTHELPVNPALLKAMDGRSERCFDIEIEAHMVNFLRPIETPSPAPQ